MAQVKNPRKLKTLKHHQSTYKLKRTRLRIAHRKHTGKWLPFYCTSYALVFFLLVFAGALVLFATNATKANPSSGSIQLSGVVNGPPPDSPAKITFPSSGFVAVNTQQEVRGTCLQDMYIEVYRSNIFAGMTQCSSEGTFQLIITLISGDNDIVAKTRDSLGRYGPDSERINVRYLPPISMAQPQNSQDSYQKSLLVYTKAVQRGLILQQKFNLDYEIDGGVKPYTVSIDWGDGSANTLINHSDIGNFNASHSYSKAGQMTVRVSVIDSAGNQASIQAIVIVHDITGPVTTMNTCDYSKFNSSFLQYCTKPTQLEVAVNYIWPALVVAVLMTASFWIGEKVMLKQINH